MPYGAYQIFSILLATLLVLTWKSNQMGESNVTAVLLIAMGANLMVIILAKCGVDLR